MSYADDARTTFADLLSTLERLCGKALSSGMNDDVLRAKLAEDMFDLELQFRVAANQVLLALIRNGQVDLPLDEAPYGSLTFIQKRMTDIAQLVQETTSDRWLPAESEIDFTLPNGRRFVMTAAEHIRDWTLPNIYFHTTMAYAILRHRGVELGKFDFVAQMARHSAG